jgi:hypothetical protein
MRLRKAFSLVMTAGLFVSPPPYRSERPLPEDFCEISYLLPKRMLKCMELTT